MINKLKAFFDTDDKKRLMSNFINLFILQGLNLLLPLVTFSYLIRVIGVEKFGLISFSLALITYFQIVTDYGFNSTATRDISTALDDKEKQKDIFNEVMSTKFFLLLLSFIILLIVVFTFEIFRKDIFIYLTTFGSVVGQALFPVWFFQGVQKMKYITILNVITKFIFTIAIFIFINEQQDYYLVPIFSSLGFIIAGILSLYFIKRDFHLKFELKSFKDILNQLNKGKFIFLSELKISLFTNTNILILGILAGNQAVGYFSSAEKLARAIGGIQIPLSNAIFPHFSKEMLINKKKVIQNILNITRIGSVFFIILISTCFIFAPKIILTIYGSEMTSSILLFRILIIIPLASFLDTMFGKQILINLGMDNLYFRVILAATIFNLCINIPVTYFYHEIGTAMTLMMTQVFIVIGMWYFVKKQIKLNL